VILKFILEKQDLRVWTGFSWFWIGSNFWSMWKR